MTWQLIETLPKVDASHQWVKCDLWAETYVLENSETGKVRKTSKRFPDCILLWVPPPTVGDSFSSMNSLTASQRWEGGPPKGWKITHWVPLPEAPTPPPEGKE